MTKRTVPPKRCNPSPYRPTTDHPPPAPPGDRDSQAERQRAALAELLATTIKRAAQLGGAR